MLVDTSVWIDHFRRRDEWLTELLEEMHVWTHPFVIGELACGNLAHRSDILGALATLPQVPVVSHEEALEFIERQKLHGTGLGWIDVHLLASARLAHMPLMSSDKKLAAVATDLKLKPQRH